jgi:hypothetical protein
VWCHSPGPLEIDHIGGGGNQHRAQIGIKLHVWVWREYERTGFAPAMLQTLCRRCHDIKSGRIPMPAREGATSVQITFPNDLVEALSKRASLPEYKDSKSAVVVQAVTEWLKDTPNETLITALHQRLDSLTDHLITVHTALEHMAATMRAHTAQIQGLEEALQRQRQELVSAYDRVRTRTQTNRHWLTRFLHG